MTRLHYVKKARKCPQRGSGIRKGDPYYWWQFYRCPRQVSKTRPRRAQLTRSSFLGAIYDLQDYIGSVNINSVEDASVTVEHVKEVLTELQSECESSRENLPENFQQDGNSTYDTLTERIDGLQSWLDNLESLDPFAFDETEDDEYVVQDEEGYDSDGFREELRITDPEAF